MTEAEQIREELSGFYYFSSSQLIRIYETHLMQHPYVVVGLGTSDICYVDLSHRLLEGYVRQCFEGPGRQQWLHRQFLDVTCVLRFKLHYESTVRELQDF